MMRRMFGSIGRALWADQYGAPALIGRLLSEYARPHWLGYLFSFALMAIAAGCTSYMAYLVGHAVNEAYLAHDFAAIRGLIL